MNCKDLKSKLIFYVEGELSTDEMRSFRHHLNHCKECSNSVSLLKETFGAIEKEKAMEVNPYLLSKTMNRLKEQERGQYESKLSQVLRPVFIGFMFMVAIGGGIFMGANFAGEPSPIQHSDLIDPYFNEMQGESIEMFFLNDMPDE
ncbi:zf-HC2 domain-containing protein [Marinifilum fragile]|uniref:anti-sigma factor family protein n=1 Tax=Marinifilum fragile TaxID=570161 RepID=UPI002AA92C9F|nr:zf-HC2 domain-containing protein [Marinifilum fragile]